MLLAEVDLTELAGVSSKALMYVFVTLALIYIYSTKRKGFFLFIISFSLFASTRGLYSASLILNFDSVYYLTVYYFAMSFLALASLRYNQKINLLTAGLILTTLFSILVNFIPPSIAVLAIRIFALVLHFVVIISFIKNSNKNLGDVFIILGLSLSMLLVTIQWFVPNIYGDELLLKKLVSEFMKDIDGLGLTIGFLLKIILDHEKQFKELTLIDDLTELANRRSLIAYAEDLVSKKYTFEMALIRIRGIRVINENYGHQAGDDAIINISQQLKSLLIGNERYHQNSGYLARLGGNLFVYIRLNNKHNVIVIEEFLRKRIKALITTKNKKTTIEIGIAKFPDHGDNFIETLNAAEIVLAQKTLIKSNSIKQAELSQLQYYRQQQTMAKALISAIEKEEIDVHYQPKYSIIPNECKNNKPKLIAAEALARWTYKGNAISPFVFITLAEEYDLISDLDTLVMKKAWFKATELAKSGFEMKIAVNYSSISMTKQGALNKLVRQIMDEHQFNPKLLEIEITESAMAQSENTLEQLESLRELGCSIAIDDFGTGYSNLSQLQSLPLDTLKIDKAFIDLIDTNPLVTEFIIDMAHKLNLNIVAEGVEQQEQLEWLKSRGCQQIQGYLLSKPLPEKEFVELIAQENKYI